MKLIPRETLLADTLVLHEMGMPPGLSVPWLNLQKLYSVAPAQFTLVTGVPGSGKSEFLDALIIELLRAYPQARCAFYSPENMPYELHVAKLAAKWMGRPFGVGPSQRMSKNEVESFMREEGGRRIHFLDIGNRSETIFEMLALTTEQPQTGLPMEEFDPFWWTEKGKAPFASGIERPFFLVIDPWNFIEKRTTMSEADYLSAALSTVDKYAHFTNCHIFIVAHPTKLERAKDGTTPVPRAYDVSGGAHWFNKADNIICVHRTNKEDMSAPVQIHVQKVRFNHCGKVGMCELKRDKLTGKYFESAPQNPAYDERSRVF